ncbi:MAG: PepSY domain-containing protein [Steroidobacteraceae bacterium]
MRAFRTTWIAAAALVLCAGGLTVCAHEVPPRAPRAVVHRMSPQHPRLSIDQAVQLAQRHFRARVVRAETQTQGGRTIYVLRMLDGAGRVFVVRVDAVSGAIL